jgi:hypothetical protein
MPVILTTMKSAMYGWAPQNEARASQRPLPDDALKIVAHSTERMTSLPWRLITLDSSRQEPSGFRLSDQAH